MVKIYKRLVCFIIIPVIVAIFPILVFADSEKTAPYDWYFKPTDDNTQPELCPEARFLQNYPVITIGDSNTQDIYLTFDAGYDKGTHTKILDALKVSGVRAAFFVDGNFVKSNPDLVLRMHNEGHLVCNHSLKHANMTRLTDFEKYSEQIVGWQQLVSELGVPVNNYFRFPEGKFSELALEYNERLGQTSVFWSFAYYDWDNEKQMSEEKALEKIYSRVHNGAVLLLHSTSEVNARILPELLSGLKQKGYTFKSISQIG